MFDDLPEDSELAFLQLEKSFRNELQTSVNNTNYNEDSAEDYLRYIARTLAARTALELDILKNWITPAAPDFSIDLYRNFLTAVEHQRTVFEIRHSRRNKGLTVRFDSTAKAKLRHYVLQIRAFVDKLEIDDWKRDDFHNAISTFELEIDRDRSRLGVFGDLVVKAGAIIGDAAENAEPVRKWIDSIARLIWGAQMQERVEALPAPKERKEIPAPPKQIPVRKRETGGFDDEIPF